MLLDFVRCVSSTVAVVVVMVGTGLGTVPPVFPKVAVGMGRGGRGRTARLLGWPRKFSRR